MHRLLPLISLLACTPAVAHCHIDHQLSFIEVDAATGLPVADPNGIVEPGQGALITLSVFFQPVVGAGIVPPYPSPVGQFRVHAFRSTRTLELGVSAAALACGTWNDLQLAAGFDGRAGVPSGCGSSLECNSIAAFQSPAGANQDNPVVVWQGIWIPDEYSSRTITFRTDFCMWPGLSGLIWLEDTGAPHDYVSTECTVSSASIHIPIHPGDPCYPDCDGSGTLNINDFLCFIDEFAAASMLPPSQQIEHYANCNGSTTEPILTVNDFLCFIDAFAQGCP